MILVQPKIRELSEYNDYAVREGLGFELLDFAFPAVLTDEKLGKRLADAYLTSGAPVRSLHGAFIDVNVASNDPEIRETSWNRCIDCCEYAVKTGAENVVFHTNFFPALDNEPYFESWYAGNAEFYGELVKTYDVKIFIENCLDHEPKRLAALMERINDPRVRVCLDVGHANYSRAGIGEWLDVLHPWIGYLHLNDNMGLYDDHLPCGRGTVDWAEFERGIERCALEPVVTLEVAGLAAVSESIAFLRKNAIYPYNKPVGKEI